MTYSSETGVSKRRQTVHAGSSPGQTLQESAVSRGRSLQLAQHKTGKTCSRHVIEPHALHHSEETEPLLQFRTWRYNKEDVSHLQGPLDRT